ncbi:hypothetical protein BDD12DRAFT_810207 [Trichophaea hybrida]|nr:hypothetical protein BDD12DRAFT_810207 [Trichophaea hybrida]
MHLGVKAQSMVARDGAAVKTFTKIVFLLRNPLCPFKFILTCRMLPLCTLVSYTNNDNRNKIIEQVVERLLKEKKEIQEPLCLEFSPSQKRRRKSGDEDSGDEDHGLRIKRPNYRRENVKDETAPHSETSPTSGPTQDESDGSSKDTPSTFFGHTQEGQHLIDSETSQDTIHVYRLRDSYFEYIRGYPISVPKHYDSSHTLPTCLFMTVVHLGGQMQ